jgi:hypothetical protein
MKNIILSIILCFSLVGCSNFNPRMQNRIDNKNGKIDEIKNNQNGLMLELGKLRQDAEIQNSQLKEVQQGMLNLNATGIRNENKGVQILQGDGALILIFALGTVAMLLFYKRKSDKNEKIANIMAKEVMLLNDQKLNDKILNLSIKTKLEKDVYKMMFKHIRK